MLSRQILAVITILRRYDVSVASKQTELRIHFFFWFPVE